MKRSLGIDEMEEMKDFPSDDIVYISSTKHYNVFHPIQRLLKKIRK